MSHGPSFPRWDAATNEIVVPSDIHRRVKWELDEGQSVYYMEVSKQPSHGEIKSPVSDVTVLFQLQKVRIMSDEFDASTTQYATRL